MRAKVFLLGSVVLLLLSTACKETPPETSPAASQPAAGEAGPIAVAAPAVSPAAAEPSGAAPATPLPASPAQESVLASQVTNWNGVVAEVTEFRRKGNTLTVKVRLRNQGGAEIQPEIRYEEVYVMDLAAGKKYTTLQDEAGSYIAALRSGWKDRWYDTLKPGQSQLLWMKFPAPPAEVRAVTLQIPGMPPFEDLAIQDS